LIELIATFVNGCLTDINYRKRFIEKHKSILPFTKDNKHPDFNNIIKHKMQFLLYKKGDKVTTT